MNNSRMIFLIATSFSRSRTPLPIGNLYSFIDFIN